MEPAMAKSGTSEDLPRQQVPFLLGLAGSAQHDRCEAACRHPPHRLVAPHFAVVAGVFVVECISWRVNAIFHSDLRHGNYSLPTGDVACLQM